MFIRIKYRQAVYKLTHMQIGKKTCTYRSEAVQPPINKTCRTINQSINLYRAIVQRRVLQCGYAESKRNVLRPILNVLTDGAVRQLGGIRIDK